MIRYYFLLFFFVSVGFVQGQELYIQTFGDSQSKPIIFLHGGPGYNSAGFEYTTAQNLANKGFFVIVYDRRGEGRSIDSDAQYNFEESFKDINAIYAKYNITKAGLIGHSFGGIVATLYAEKNLEKIDALYLVSSPIDFQESFRHIIKTSEEIYKTNNDQNNLKYIAMLKKTDTTSLSYSSYSFMHAMQNGFYTADSISAEAKTIYIEAAQNPDYIKYTQQMTSPPTQGFWKNESYTTIDLSHTLQKLKSLHQFPIVGIYGDEDGLFAEEQIKNLEKVIGKENVYYIENASHNVFIDSQLLFIEILDK